MTEVLRRIDRDEILPGYLMEARRPDDSENTPPKGRVHKGYSTVRFRAYEPHPRYPDAKYAPPPVEYYQVRKESDV